MAVIHHSLFDYKSSLESACVKSMRGPWTLASPGKHLSFDYLMVTLFKIECLNLMCVYHASLQCSLASPQTWTQLQRPQRAHENATMPHKCVSTSVSIPSSVLYAGSVWVDVSDRKPSRELTTITILCLDDSSRSGCVVGGGGSNFFPFFPFGTAALFKRHLLSLALPCTSLAPSSTCQPVKKKKKTKNRKLEASL